MTGILVQLVVSWLIAWFVEKQHLNVLGLSPRKQRLADFFLFLMLSACCSASGFLLRIWWGREQWELNPLFNYNLLLEGIWWNVKSVLFEELIFRGVLLYIFIKRLGVWKGIFISAVAFGVYHWFSYGILGDISKMTLYFFVTGIMGIIYAYAYAKTFSLYIPVAIHFGWNFIQSFVFSNGPIGKGILVLSENQVPVTVSWAAYITILALPVLGIWLSAFFLLRRKKQAPVPGLTV